MSSEEKVLDFLLGHMDRFDATITDYNMPNMCGDRLAREIHEIRPDMPIIMITGYAHHISHQQSQELGIHSLLTKPLETGSLRRAMQEAVCGQAG